MLAITTRSIVFLVLCWWAAHLIWGAIAIRDMNRLGESGRLVGLLMILVSPLGVVVWITARRRAVARLANPD